jgi:hypothetical protein
MLTRNRHVRRGKERREKKKRERKREKRKKEKKGELQYISRMLKIDGRASKDSLKEPRERVDSECVEHQIVEPIQAGSDADHNESKYSFIGRSFTHNIFYTFRRTHHHFCQLPSKPKNYYTAEKCLR